jgi:hypothetical protein
MSTNYYCKKCSYKTINFNDLLKHINKQKKCNKNIESYQYSEDQLIVLTLIPYVNGTQNIDLTDIEYLKESDLLNDNIKELLDSLKNIDITKSKICKYCNEEHKKIIDLKKHIIISCFHKELDKRKIDKERNEQSIIIEGNNNSLSNCLNNYSTTNNNITNNIYFELKNPIPFDDDWDISKIDSLAKGGILINNLMYTTLLDEILKNETNLNVILDKKNDSGIVYKNDIDKYIKMRSKDIVNNTMVKLRKQLLDITSESKDIFFNDCIEYSKAIINNKYNEYVKDEDLQNGVSSCIKNIYAKKKDNAVHLFKNVLNTTTDKNNMDGF